MDSVTKVGHVVLSLAVGGLEKMVCELTRSCRTHHISSVIYCLDERGALADEMEQSGIKVVLLKRRRGFDLGLVFSLAKRFRQDGLTAVHTHNLDPMIYGGLAAWFAGIGRRIHTQHDVYIGTYSIKDRVKLVLCSRFIGTMVGVSSETTRMLAACGVRPARCETIANGVNLTKFSRRGIEDAASLPHGAAENKELVLGAVARLSPEKGLGCLLHAFALVQKSSPVPISLEIAGDGGERKALEELASRIGLTSAVRFRGSLARVDEFLRTLDIFVLPSLTEGIPLALLEAMASQLPVIGTRVGGVPEVVVHDESGILVSPNNPEELAQAILDLVREPGRRKRLAQNAKERVKGQFGLDTMVRRYRRLYLADLSEGWLIRVAKKAVRQLLPSRLILWSHQVEKNVACLTLDDGPDAIYTPQILDILKQFNVKATFFLIGNRIEDHKIIVHRMVNEGHELGNHSYSHPKIDQLSWSEVVSEIVRAKAVIESCSPRPSMLFRPPEGNLCLGSIVGAWLNGQRIVMWSVDLKDCFADSSEDVDDALADASINPGDIILYHGDSGASLEALPRVLERTRRDGIKLVLLSELLGSR